MYVSHVMKVVSQENAIMETITWNVQNVMMKINTYKTGNASHHQNAIMAFFKWFFPLLLFIVALKGEFLESEINECRDNCNEAIIPFMCIPNFFKLFLFE